MKIEIYKYKPKIWIAVFPSDYEMVSSLMRIQENAEGTYGFKGNPNVSHIEIIDAYYAQHGEMTYFQDISGFVLSSDELHEFYHPTCDDECTEGENSLHDALMDACPSDKMCNPWGNDYFEFQLVCVAHRYSPDREGNYINTDELIASLVTLAETRMSTDET